MESTSIYAALAAVQSELKAPKGQMNTFGGYRYRSCEDILEAVKPILKAHDLLLTLSDEPKVLEGWHYIEATAKLESLDAKLRATLVTRDNTIFNNRYEGSPKAGKVKIPVRDTEVAVKAYDKANGVDKITQKLERLVRMMAKLWAQEIMFAETMEDAKALYERCPRLLKEKVKAILIKSGFEEITQ